MDFGNRGIQSSGLLTVGITNAQGSIGPKDGIYWSMALSHYRYYGRALNAVGEIDDRLTIEQLHLVALGSLLRGWNVPRKDVEPAARWLIALEGCLGRTKSLLGCPAWLATLMKAARAVLDTDSPRKTEVLALVDFGQRRGANLLHSRNQPCLPWFGLRFRHIVRGLSAETPEECAVEYLRSVASAGDLRYDEALITSVTNTTSNKQVVQHHYFTANTRYDHQEDEVVRKSAKVADVEDVPDLEDGYAAIATAGKYNRNASDDEASRSQGSLLHPKFSRHQSWSGSFSHHDRFLAGRPHPHPRDMDSSAFGGPGSAPQYLDTSMWYEEHSYNATGGLLNDCDALLPDKLGWFPTSPVRFQKFMGDPKGTTRLWLAHGRAADECDKFTNKIESLQSGTGAELLDIETAIRLLDEGGDLEPRLVWQYLEGPGPYEPVGAIKEILGKMWAERERFGVTVRSLGALEVATNIYNRLDGATISSSIVERGLHDAKWASMGRNPLVTRSMVFSCIAFMETGKISLDAERLEQVIALSSGNSLFVSNRLLTDPYDDVVESSVTRIVGNVGLPGVNLLIPPAASPLTLSLNASFRAVTYAPFNGRREDNFKGTTLHLSFTSHKFPLDYGVTGIVDHQVFFVESIISIHDSGQWVADLDILEAFGISDEDRVRIPRRLRQKICTHPEGMLDTVLEGITSIDTWEEVLDTCPNVNIIRAHKNWPARLATAVMLSTRPRMDTDSEDWDNDDLDATESGTASKGGRYSILENGDNVCWVCLQRRLAKTGKMSTPGQFYIIA